MAGNKANPAQLDLITQRLASMLDELTEIDTDEYRASVLDEAASGGTNALLDSIENSMTHYVRSMDNPMAALGELVDELEKTKSVVTLPTLSRIERAAKKFQRESNRLYGDFRNSRESIYKIAKAVGQSTRRRRAKHASKPLPRETVDLVKQTTKLSKNVLRNVGQVAESSAQFLRLLRSYTRGRSVVPTPDEDALKSLVNNFIDKVRGPNSDFFEGFNAIAKRTRAAWRAAKDEFAIREQSNDDVLELDSENDPELGDVDA